MKTRKLLLIAACFFFACNTERQTQIKTGTYHIVKGRVNFSPNGQWKEIPADTSFNGFLVRNTSIKKPKP